MERIDVIKLKIKKREIIFVDNESDEMKYDLVNNTNFTRLGKLKDVKPEIIISLIESKFFPEIMFNGYKNYYPIEGDEIYMKPYLMSYLNSFLSLLLSRKIVIESLFSPQFIEEIRNDMQLSLINPTIYLQNI